MGLLSDYAQNKVSDAFLRGQAIGAPATLYFALLKCSKGARANSTAYALNDTIAVLANDSKYHLYKCTTAGTTAASQSTLYPGVANEVITDGTAVFTEQNAALDANTAEVEPSTGGYGRVALTASLANWSGTQGAGTTVASTGTGGQSSNNAVITFPTITADYQAAGEKIWGWAIYDAASAGNLWGWAPLTTLQSVLNGQAPASFAAGALVTTIGN
jgi:hypothetical protein